MEPVIFKKATGQTEQGQKLIVPGFELIDWVYVQDGFMGRVFELATGLEVMESQGFTQQEAIRDIVSGFIKKNISDTYLLKKIHENDHQHGRIEFAVKNESPAYKAYKQKVAIETQEQPFYYSEQDRAEIQSLIDIMVEEKLPNIEIIQGHLNKKVNKWMGKPPTGDGIKKIFHYQRNSYYAMIVRGMGMVMPDVLRPYNEWETKNVTWEQMVIELNWGRKHDITKHIPEDLLNEFALLWELANEKNNYYGYQRFMAHGMASLIRLTIDIRKERDVKQDIIDIRTDMEKAQMEIADESQPYVKRPHEIYI